MENPVSVPHLVHEVLRMPGEPLAPATRSFFETFYGCNFTQVRVHTDARASLSARMVNTRAYTVGCHIVFAEHGYEPFTPAGRKLLAHELAHVVQQGHEAVFALDRIPLGRRDDVFEREADECSRAAESSHWVRIASRTGRPVLQGWFTDLDCQRDSSIRRDTQGQTHEHITRSVLNEPAFTARFHRLCKQFLIDGAAEPDREKPDVEQRLGHNLTGAVFHGWGASEAAIDGFIMSFVRTAADYLNRSARGLDYCLREVLGKALHAAQDKAAHMTPCRTAAGGACNPREMDIPRINAEGWRRAFENTRIVFRQLDPLLTPNSRHWLANGPTR